MKEYVFRDPRPSLRAYLALFGGLVLLLLNLPYLGWWSTGTPGILLGLGCLMLGAVELPPRSDVGIVIAGCLRIAGYLMLALMAIYIVRAVLP